LNYHELHHLPFLHHFQTQVTHPFPLALQPPIIHANIEPHPAKCRSGIRDKVSPAINKSFLRLFITMTSAIRATQSGFYMGKDHPNFILPQSITNHFCSQHNLLSIILSIPLFKKVELPSHDLFTSL
jgi:hypothetical protein